jgi:photosystem II stability/assembly factor-like uncharacterized protein
VYEIGGHPDGVTQKLQMVLRKSTDDGVSWTQYKPTTQEGYAYAVLPHPTNDAIIYLGGYLREPDGSFYPVIYKTTDRGVTWNKSGSSVLTQQWDQVNILECDNSNPNKILAGSDRALYASTDGGASWMKILDNVSVYGLVIDPVNSNYLYVGTRNNGVKVSTNGGMTWTDRNENLGSLDVESMAYDGVNGVLYVGTMNSGAYRLSIAAPVSTPQPPSLLAPADQTINVPLNTTLTWNPSSDATQYHLQLSTVQSFTSCIINDSTITGTLRAVGPLSLATTYYWRVRGINAVGPGAYSSVRQFRTILTVGIEKLEDQIPREYVLMQNYPNPFNPSTTIRFGIPEATAVTVTIYNMLGEQVARLLSSDLSAGYYTVHWNTEGVPSGVYIYRLQAGEFVESKKLTLLR